MNLEDPGGFTNPEEGLKLGTAQAVAASATQRNFLLFFVDYWYLYDWIHLA